MKKNLFLKSFLIILIISVLEPVAFANDRVESELLNVTPVSFTVPSAGWYRVGELTRGLIKVAVSITGGLHRPQNIIIEAYKDWGGGLFLNANGSRNTYITQARLTYDANKYFIEIYATQALTSNAYFYHYETEGYAGSFTLNNGSLPLGGGVIKKITGNLVDKAYSSGGMNLMGNVGIGTSIPDEKLTVKGTINSEEVRVEAVGADFVFAPDYNLMPLTKIEAFVNKNHHLPEVPSAAEMQANGVELGKMNMLLLQKIEELTLHQIEQEKKGESQSKIIELLLLKLEAQEKEIAKINQNTNLKDD